MDVEQQQGTWSQLSLFEAEAGSVRHGASGEGGTGPAAHEEWQASAALNRERALTGNLMERMCERENLNRAYKRVKANKGAPGIDGMTVGELYDWLKEHKEELVELLLVQQAILQVLEGIVDPTFSESSYGFRRGRNAHQAVKQAAEYVAEGRGIVVDIDLEKFVRPGEPRHAHGPAGATRGRQATVAHYPLLPGSRDDVGRRMRRAP